MQAIRQIFSLSSSLMSVRKPLLAAQVPPMLTTFEQVRGVKHKNVLELRCRHCRFEKKNDFWHVTCSQSPRHNQVELSTKESLRDRWIMTHITRSGKPFMKKPEAYIIGTCPPGPFDYKQKLGQYLRIKPKYLYPYKGLPPKTRVRNFEKALN